MRAQTSAGSPSGPAQTMQTKFKVIEKRFADFPLSALPDPRTRSVLVKWRDQLAHQSRRPG